MTIYLCPEFIRDLVSHADVHFAKRVLNKVLTSGGGFAPDINDHLYQGIEDCWIRYVSGGNSAYRAIFIRKGADIYWYRTGEHSIENNLTKPGSLANSVAIGESPISADVLSEHAQSRYLKSSHPRLLRELIGYRRLIPHKEVIMVSPRLSINLVAPTGDVGRLMDSVIEFGGRVSVITRPPAKRDLNQYAWLVARGAELLIHESVNARLYSFEVDQEQISPNMGNPRSVAIVGSAALTEDGLNIDNKAPCEEELCYEIREDDLEGSTKFIFHLADSAIPFDVYRAKLDQ